MSASASEAETFGTLLLRHRQAAGLSQELLAERAHLSVNAIQALERGRRATPRLSTVTLLANGLELVGAERAAFIAVATGRSPESTEQPDRMAPLPSPLTALLGREQELADVSEALGPQGVRLLTLTGPGGIGKTRLALAVAAQCSGAYADGVAFVDLSPVRDPGLVAPTIARALGVQETNRNTPEELLARYLRERELFVVIDNFEHVLPAAKVIADLLAACTRVAIVATSREPLRVPGEQVWPVPPLGLPRDDDPDPAASEAVRLFAERARLAQREFAVDQDNRARVADVCRRLDGIPLAIELAAARLPTLGLDELAARLDDRFRVLTLGSRAAPARHQTLRAVVDWSYALLGGSERRLLGRLSVFAGGWSLAMAEAICAGEGIDPADILDLLSGLVQKSLVVVSNDGDGTRYGFLETLRQYAAERLIEAGEDQPVRARHLEWCLGLAERADADKDGPRRAAWLGQLERNYANLRAALEWSLAQPGSTEAALRLVGTLGWFWWLRGYAREGSQWMERVLGQPRLVTEPAQVSPAARARAWALAEAGRLRQRQGDLSTARGLLEESLRLAQQVSYPEAEACARLYLGELALEQGNAETARRHLLEGLALARSSTTRGPAAGRFLHWLGHVAEAEARPAEAAGLYAEARELARTSGDALFAAVATRGLASAAIEQGDLAGARSLLLETLALSRQVDKATADDAVVLSYFARLAAAGGQPEQAVRLAGAVRAVLEQAGTQLFRHDRDLLEQALTSARRLLTASHAAAADAEGRAMTRAEVLSAISGPGAEDCLTRRMGVGR